MPHKKLSRNALCPCGSGRKYGACCWDKGFEWVEDEAGTVFRSTPMTPEVREALGQLRQALGARHGQAPGPDDPLFPDMSPPEHLVGRGEPASATAQQPGTGTQAGPKHITGQLHEGPDRRRLLGLPDGKRRG
jgi:hypothetical protein